MLKSLTLAKLFPQQVGTGWLMWLTKVAGEAIHGWFQFRSNAFEKLNKETGREESTYRRKTFNFVWIHTILRLD
ncbi:hypothetical protein YC2023_049361 [Brassica napus]